METAFQGQPQGNVAVDGPNVLLRLCPCRAGELAQRGFQLQEQRSA
jgi:hypothetical protein